MDIVKVKVYLQKKENFISYLENYKNVNAYYRFLVRPGLVWILSSEDPQPPNTYGIWTMRGLWNENAIWYE